MNKKIIAVASIIAIVAVVLSTTSNSALDEPTISQTIFVDAVPNRTSPGTIYVIEPDTSEFESMQAEVSMLDAHTMNPMHVLRMARSMGAKFNRLLLVGCEPETLGGDEGLMGLSEPVATAVEKAADIVERLVADILTEKGETVFA